MRVVLTSVAGARPIWANSVVGGPERLSKSEGLSYAPHFTL